MKQSKLSKQASQILGMLELDADTSLVELAQKLKRQPSAIQRSIKLLIEREVILGKTAIIDISKLGLIEYGFYFELGQRTPNQFQKFINFLKSYPGVSWIAEIGGGYDLTINILTDHPQNIHKFFELISERFKDLIIRKEMVQRSTRIRCYRSYFGAKKGIRFKSGEAKGTLSLKEDEINLIKNLDQLKFESYRDLAKMHGVGLSKISRLIARLKEKQVLLGFGYRIDTQQFGYEQYRVLLIFKNLSSDLVKIIEQKVSLISGVKLIVRCLGQWDYELECDVSSHKAAREISNQIWEKLGSDLLHVKFIPIYEHLKYISFGTSIVR
jgi:DNA-binding Lrp family transcriptional regulator